MGNVSYIETLSIMGLLAIAGGFFCLIVLAILWTVIFKKAGYAAPLILGILMAIPGVNIIMFLIFALSEWPILRLDK